MDCGRLMFDSSSSSSPHHGHMLILGGSGNSIFRGGRCGLGLEEGSIKRRPFFTSHDELFDDDYYDEQLLPDQKKRRLTPEQVHLLEKSFETENKLEPERKSELAKKLGLQPRQVAVWFQNRRARWKTKQLERDFDGLKAAYDSLLADHDSILKDNERLRSQVVNLTEKLQAKELAAAIVGPTGEAALGGGDKVTKADDHLSTGSGGSAVVDGEGPQQLVDSSSGDSAYFQESFHEHGHCCIVGPTEEDDGSDDGCNYLPAAAAAGGMFEDENHDHAADNWWGVWN